MQLKGYRDLQSAASRVDFVDFWHVVECFKAENNEKHKIVAFAGLGEMICEGMQDLDGQDAQKYAERERERDITSCQPTRLIRCPLYLNQCTLVLMLSSPKSGPQPTLPQALHPLNPLSPFEVEISPSWGDRREAKLSNLQQPHSVHDRGPLARSFNRRALPVCFSACADQTLAWKPDR